MSSKLPFKDTARKSTGQPASGMNTKRPVIKTAAAVADEVAANFKKKK